MPETFEIPENACFVIMSFDEKYDHVYSAAIEPAIRESGLLPIRTDQSNNISNIPRDIIRSIVYSRIIIADLSAINANVFYELGVAHTCGKKVIALTNDIDSLPFDIKHYRSFGYKEGRENLKFLKKELTEEISRLLDDERVEIANLVFHSAPEHFNLQKIVRNNINEQVAQIKRADKFADYIGLKKKGELSDNLVAADIISKHVLQKMQIAIQRPFLICVGGSAGIGKSTFSKVIIEKIKELTNGNVSIEKMETDSYMMAREDRIIRNLSGSHPSANNSNKMFEDVDKLRTGQKIKCRPYNHEDGMHGKEIEIVPSDILIIEGSYALHPFVSKMNGQFGIYIHANAEKAKELRFLSDLERGYDVQSAFAHAEEEYRQYQEFVFPFVKLTDCVVEVEEYWKLSEQVIIDHV